MPEPIVTDARGSRRVFELMRRVYSSSDTGEILEEIVRGVVDVLGFGVAAIARLEGTMLVMTNVAGPEDARQAILGNATKAIHILDEYRHGDRWGILRFVPHGRLAPEDYEATWLPDIEPPTDPNGWHPDDTLYAPLYSATGDLLGNLAVDLPPGGTIPDLELREQLELFAVQAGLALSNAQQRERLTRRLALGEAVTEVARAGTRGDIDEVLDACARTVHALLGASQVWVRCHTDEPGAVDHSAGHPRPAEAADRIGSLRAELAELWRSSITLVEVGRDGTGLGRLPQSRRELIEQLSEWNDARGLLAPIGVGTQVLGFIAAAFPDDHPDPTEEDRQAITDLAREVGRVVHTTRLHLRERRLVSELQELDRYKQELIATISHELKTPLTSIIGHVELMEESGFSERSLSAVGRNADRLHRLTQNLLDYARVQERRDNLRMTVDLADLCASSVELVAFQAETAGVEIDLTTDTRMVLVEADPEELARVVDNLVGNAVKYTVSGGRVSVQTCVDGDEAVLCVADTGLGISSLDQKHLFSAFHRSSNPQALSLPGTGLGLAISKRITEQHGGTITVESALGQGSTFTLRLPRRD